MNVEKECKLDIRKPKKSFLSLIYLHFHGIIKSFFPRTHTHATLLMSTLFAARVAAPNPLSVRDEKIPS
jgi:hypothetical protein